MKYESQNRSSCDIEYIIIDIIYGVEKGFLMRKRKPICQYHISTCLFFIRSYDVIRRDRDLEKTNKKKGGGVLIAAKKNLHLKRLLEMQTENAEDLWASITLETGEVIRICCIYIPGKHLYHF